MSRPAASYSTSLQVGLVVSLVVALGLGVLHVFGARTPGPPLDATLRDLQARAVELVTLIDERRAGHLTETFVRSQSAHWQRVTREVSAELVKKSDDDATGRAARGHQVALRLLTIGAALPDTRMIDAGTRREAVEAASAAAALRGRSP